MRRLQFHRNSGFELSRKIEEESDLCKTCSASPQVKSEGRHLQASHSISPSLSSSVYGPDLRTLPMAILFESSRPRSLALSCVVTRSNRQIGILAAAGKFLAGHRRWRRDELDRRTGGRNLNLTRKSKHGAKKGHFIVQGVPSPRGPGLG